jgi:hypothetical protein
MFKKLNNMKNLYKSHRIYLCGAAIEKVLWGSDEFINRIGSQILFGVGTLAARKMSDRNNFVAKVAKISYSCCLNDNPILKKRAIATIL